MASKNNNSNSECKNFYVLGDSLSDNGTILEILNNLSFVRNVEFSSPFHQGRSFSNGPTAVEYVAKYLGLEEFRPGWSYSFFGKCHEQQGHNYAVSYATASEILDPIFSYFFNKFRLANQLNAVIKHHPDVGKGDLFFIIIGGNDIMVATAYNSVKAEKVLKQAVSEICNALRVLNEHGVKHVVVANAPEVGLIPAFNKDEKARELAAKLTQSFNAKLANGLDYMKKSTDLEIKAFDLNSKMKSMLGKYKSKGLNDRDACLSNITDQFGGGGVGKNIKILLKLIFKGEFDIYYNSGCSKETLKDYFFFDYFHPTAGPHCEVGNEMYELIKNSVSFKHFHSL